MAEHTDFDFTANIDHSLKNERMRANLNFAMTNMAKKRQALFSDEDQFEHLRSLAQESRQRALNHLPEILVRLEENCTKNGIRVHWAWDAAEACRTILDISRAHGAKKMVKGKSMVSEEIHLNRYLEEHAMEVMETDLGEYILQLAGEKPSHIIVPAIHKNREQVAQLFHEKIPGTPYTNEPTELTKIAREVLRRKYFEADIGLSGVNMAIAETGTLLLVENEGNGRMCTTVPPVHIAVTGIEKVVAKFSDVPPILRLLTGSATGQGITTYVNMISGPRKPGENDGPTEVHLVLLDNGRSHILADPELRQTLQCIRCGTCMYHCPVYSRLGGHAYHFTYPGPIGQVLTPQMEGLEKAGDLLSASTLCNVCAEVCPVKIPLPELIRRLRKEAHAKEGTVRGHGSKANPAERFVWKGWALVNRHRMLNAAATKIAGFVTPLLPEAGLLKNWTRCRVKPRIARQSLHELVKKEGVKDE